MESELTAELIEKFWSRVKTGMDDECWEWQGSRNHHGYGMFQVRRGKLVRAHRLSFLIAFGWLDPDLVVAHKCDNPSCVNPHHLIHCTQVENIHDRDEKGRHSRGPNAPKWKPEPLRGMARGERAGRSRLTADQVRAIRSEYRRGVRGRGYSSLAKKYGVADYAIEMIVKRKSWTHI